jgi:radical SAM protein with 4Fe4S-binding SPASM domain
VGDDREIVSSLGQAEANAPKMRRWLSWNPYDFEECTKCNIFPICKGGCPYKGFEENRTSHCDSWKYNLIEMLKIYYLSRLMHKSEEKKWNTPR